MDAVMRDYLDAEVVMRAVPGNREHQEKLFGVIAGLPVIPAELLADDAVKGRAMSYRAKDEVHACAFCGERARAAIVVEESPIIAAARWLDACMRCYGELHRHAYDFDDSEICSLYRVWLARDAA